MGALPRHPQKKDRRRLHNAERNTALAIWVLTLPAGVQAIRFLKKNPSGRYDGR